MPVFCQTLNKAAIVVSHVVLHGSSATIAWTPTPWTSQIRGRVLTTHQCPQARFGLSETVGVLGLASEGPGFRVSPSPVWASDGVRLGVGMAGWREWIA